MQTATLAGRALSGDGRRIDEWVDHWAQATPQSPAIRAGNTEVTYRELVDAAERIATGLRVKGVRPHDVVLVDMPRGVALLQVLLAVLKCNAVYSVVDTDWPDARYAEVAHRTRAWLAVGDPRGRPGAAPDVPRIDPVALLGHDVARPPVSSAPDNHGPCCIFFTSGSTGAPKGVLATHKAILRVAQDPYLAVGPGHGMLQAAPSPWDAFAMEVWVPLTAGGVTVINSGRYLTPDDLRTAVSRGADTVFLTTTLFNTIVEADVQAFAGVGRVYVGGERVSPLLTRRCRDEVAGIRVHNVYGPVESTIYASLFPLDDIDGETSLPIGRPIVGTTIHVLGEDRRPAPIGTTGEIAISGDGLALEYLDDPEATRKAFPLLDLDGRGRRTRVYLTGDAGHVDADGLLHIGGRLDRQFKIRGVRVEPAGVEAVIERLDGVSAVAVLALPYGAPNVTRMAACIVGSADPAAVRRAVTKVLPAGYVPDTVVNFESLPLSATGKTDLAALARLVEAAASPVAPVEPAAEAGSDPEVLAYIRELLGDSVDWDTDIFDAGASSITAIRIAHRLGQLSGSKINPAQIFHHPTPRALAELVTPAAGPASTRRSEARWQADLPSPQWRFWYLEAKSPGNGDGLTPLQHRLIGPLDQDVLAESIRVVIGRHTALRTILEREGRRGIRPVVLDPAEVPDVLTVGVGCRAEDADAQARKFLELPFRLDAELPIRALLLRIGPEDHLLSFSVHHTAFDGWSGAILCRELSEAYASLARGEAPARRESTDYRATWLTQDLNESASDREQLWAWTNELLGVPDLPLGPDPRTSTGPVDEVWVDVPDDLRAAAEHAAAEAGGSVQATLLAAWVRALREFTGADDMAIGIPVAGRTTAEAEEVIGCFTSGVAVRFRAPGGDDPGVDLDRAVDQLSTALRFQYMPIERLLVDSEPRARNRNPYCQAGFVVQNYETPELVIDGVRCEPAIPRHHHSAFELTLELWFDRGLGARIWFRADVLDQDRCRRLGELWLAELAVVSGRTVAAVPLAA